MRWRLLLAFLIDLSLWDAASFSQGPPADEEGPSSARSSPANDRFFASDNFVRFQLIQGRLRLDSPRHRKGSLESNQDGLFESISVTADRGIPSLHYVYQSSEQQLTLSVDQATSVRIGSWLPKTNEASELIQGEFGNVVWSVGHGAVADKYTGASLVHVRLLNPQVFDLHYRDLLTRILGGRSLSSLSRQVHASLMNAIADQKYADASEVRQCVNRLRSDRQSERMLAHRQLLSWGTPIVPILHQLLATDLDREQTARVRQVIEQLRPMVEDTPSTLAMMMLNDRQYWATVSSRLASDQLVAVNEHLQRTGLQEINVSDQPAGRIASGRGDW